ncbi:hypothetical protein Nepgr_001235 [Nepenthes gracilis]|uniref:Uncharacterized protein n=1 Tax=Nepenthes gracilis TaxID=150966 RepID=A0AAD3P421_NEPGR|nr:hypothetical protein Nepgr_001235 [Nepenthes gracilis]
MLVFAPLSLSSCRSTFSLLSPLSILPSNRSASSLAALGRIPGNFSFLHVSCFTLHLVGNGVCRQPHCPTTGSPGSYLILFVVSRFRLLGLVSP